MGVQETNRVRTNSHNQETYHSADRKHRLAVGLHAKSRLAGKAAPPSLEMSRVTNSISHGPQPMRRDLLDSLLQSVVGGRLAAEQRVSDINARVSADFA